MPLIVMSNNPELFRTLSAPGFVRAGVDLLVTISGSDVVDVLRRREVDIVMVEAHLPDMDGFAVCSALKQDPGCARTRVLLVLPSVNDPAMMARVAACKCDAVVTLPVEEEELYEHLAQFLAIPRRRGRRARLQIHAALRAGGAEVPARLENLSSGGMGVEVSADLEIGSTLVVRFGNTRPGSPDEVSARVAWKRKDPHGLIHLGLEFLALRPEQRLMINDLALWEMGSGEDGSKEVSMHGELDENTSLDGLLGALRGSPRVVFDMSDLERMNSSGVKSWCNFIAELAGADITFRRCSTAFTTQICMVPTVIGGGKISSVKAPYVCESCDREVERLIDMAALLADEKIREPRFPCQCGGELVLDDLAERYFAFLRTS